MGSVSRRVRRHLDPDAVERARLACAARKVPGWVATSAGPLGAVYVLQDAVNAAMRERGGPCHV